MTIVGIHLRVLSIPVCAILLVACADRVQPAVEAPVANGTPARNAAPPPRAAAPSPATPASVDSAAASATTGEARTFGNWYAACDNIHVCALYGFSRSPAQAYALIYREPGVEGDLVLTLKARTDARSDTVRVVVDGREAARLPVVGAIDGMVQAESGTAAVVDPLIAAIGEGDALGIAVAEDEPVVIRLDGAAAAMLWLDERQGAIGSERALRARGNRPMGELPPPPSPPTARAAAATAQVNLPKTLPAALAQRDEVRDCHAEVPQAVGSPLVARLGTDRMLWGVACADGAYNRGFRLYLAGADGDNVRAVALAGSDAGSGADVVFNPAFDADGMTLSSFYKARGPGDCGAAAAWVWNGIAFDPIRRSVMEPCAGIPPNDWPLLYQARIERSGDSG